MLQDILIYLIHKSLRSLIYKWIGSRNRNPQNRLNKKGVGYSKDLTVNVMDMLSRKITTEPHLEWN